MKILIAGATGLIGQRLVKSLEEKSVDLTLLGRSMKKLTLLFPHHTVLTWADLNTCSANDFDFVINLAGENIGSKRWSEGQKKKILESRTKTTRGLVSWIISSNRSNTKLFNASAIGVYGLNQKTLWDESMPLPPTDSFLADVAQAWENETACLPNDQVVTLRFGVVLDSKQGAMKQMLPAVRFGLGGRYGSGTQPFSWVLIDDVIRAIIFLLETKNAQGPYNIVSPMKIDQYRFACALGKALNRPTFFKYPSFLLRMMLGEMASELILSGVTVQPKRLLELGFKFEFETIDNALIHLFK